jgi:hypothetical protein
MSAFLRTNRLIWPTTREIRDRTASTVPNYKVPFTSAIRESANIKAVAVGLVTEAPQAEENVASGFVESR